MMMMIRKMRGKLGISTFPLSFLFILLSALLLLFAHGADSVVRSREGEPTCAKIDDSCSAPGGENLAAETRIKLRDGNLMPLLGLGVYQIRSGPKAEDAVLFALENGYRLLDTAQIYGNEESVGLAVNRSGIDREDVYVVSKVSTDAHGYDRTIESVKASLKRLGMDYVDLFLVHSPEGGYNIETYKALLDLQKEGRIRSVGVSNFEVQHLEGLKMAGLPSPAVNQIELHVFQRRDYLVRYCRKSGIAVMGYSPLARSHLLDHPLLGSLALKYKKTSAQIMLRWSLQKGYVTIPKSEKRNRILENSRLYDFSIGAGDMNLLDSTDQYTYGWDTSGYVWEG